MENELTDPKLKKSLELLQKFLDETPHEEIEKMFPPDTTPKGWLSIEEHLPGWLAKDVMQGYSVCELPPNKLGGLNKILKYV